MKRYLLVVNRIPNYADLVDRGIECVYHFDTIAELNEKMYVDIITLLHEHGGKELKQLFLDNKQEVMEYMNMSETSDRASLSYSVYDVICDKSDFSYEELLDSMLYTEYQMIDTKQNSLD